MVWIYARELNVFAEVIAAVGAEEAVATGDAGFHGNTIT
jgi:hypothetical protein